MNVRQLEAELLEESPPSEDVDGASEDSSDLPEMEGRAPSPLPELDTSTVEAVLRDLSPTPDVENPDEVETIRIQWNPLTRVSCLPSADRTFVTSDQGSVAMAQSRSEDDETAALAATVGFHRTSKEGVRRQSAVKKKNRRRHGGSRSAAAPSRSAGHRYMEDWMPHRGEEEETQEYLDRIFCEGKVTPEQFYEIKLIIRTKIKVVTSFLFF